MYPFLNNIVVAFVLFAYFSVRDRVNLFEDLFVIVVKFREKKKSLIFVAMYINLNKILLSETSR